MNKIDGYAVLKIYKRKLLMISMDALSILSAIPVEKTGDVARHLLPDNLVHDNKLTEIISKVAKFLLREIGMYEHPTLATFVYAVIVLAISLAVGFLFRWIIQHIVYIIGRKMKGNLFDELRQVSFFSKITYVIPSLTFLIFIRFTFADGRHLSTILTCITVIVMIFTIAISVNSFLDGLWNHIDTRANKRKLPLKGLVQLFKGIVWIIVTVITIAVIINKSPLALLTGLGAFAAVIMLIFKDSILGVVASVQLSEYNTLHIGDWIKVPGTDANGTVVETNLISIKVQNWDKTTTMVPPYSLVSGSFTNYSSMQQSKTRRISRTFLIDAETVKFADNALLEAISSLPFMGDYISAKLKEAKEGKDNVFADPTGLVNGSLETNLGLFRAYMKMYIDNNPAIDHESTAMVFTDQMQSNGIPLQIYCFTATSAWADYEAIQSAIFEHISVVLPKFSLSVFEEESTLSNIQQAMVNKGFAIDKIFGMPTPLVLEEEKNECSQSGNEKQTAR